MPLVSPELMANQARVFPVSQVSRVVAGHQEWMVHAVNPVNLVVLVKTDKKEKPFLVRKACQASPAKEVHLVKMVNQAKTDKMAKMRFLMLMISASSQVQQVLLDFLAKTVKMENAVNQDL